MSSPLASTPAPAAARRHDLDWLRVGAVLLVLVFHAGMPFAAGEGWHIRNAEESNLVLELNFFLSRWRMALLFLISGVGTSYALGRRGGGAYLRERARRLLLPLVVGILVVVPPQIYAERLAQGHRYASYLEFWPSVLRFVPYPTGDTSWHHLWFVAYLFAYSVALLPLFLALRTPRGRALRDRLAARLRGPALYLPALLLGGVLAALAPRWPGPQDVVHDWAFLVYYMLFFAIGYVLAGAQAAWEAIERQRRASLTLAVSAMLAVNYLRWNGLDPRWAYTPAAAAYFLLLGLVAWSWVVTILGYARRHLNRPTRALAYANEAIYPFYILHQTVVVVLASYIVRVPGSVLEKYLGLLLFSFVVTVALYECYVRPFRLVRPLFGMKPARERDRDRERAPTGAGACPASAADDRLRAMPPASAA